MRIPQPENLSPLPGGTDERLTVSTTAVALTTTWASDCTHVFITVETAAVVVTFDGSTPTASNGHTLAAGYNAHWTKARAVAAKFIRSGGSDGYIHASPMAY